MKYYKKQNIKYSIRLGFMGSILLTALMGLTWRVIDLQVFEKKFLTSQGNARTMRVVTTAPYRGMITDRNGEPLAISTPVDSVWVNPKEFDNTPQKIQQLARILEISEAQLLKRLQKNAEREFLFLKRHVSPEISDKVRKVEMNGVHLKSEYRRYYPAGEVTAQVLGFTNLDGQGQEGLELTYNEHLKGSPGSKRIIRDRRGRQVEYIEALKDMRSGQNVTLSLDQRLQYLAYRELKEAVSAHRAAAGSAVVLDVETGEILAMVNQPSYNPNLRIRHRDDSFRNRAVTDVFEPGSVIKTFSVLSALQHGRVTPATLIDTSPGWLNIGGKFVREDKNKNHGVIDIATIMKKSSNVGVTKLTLSLPPEKLWDTYVRVGFGKVTGSGFPGESAGNIIRPHKNSPFVLATMAFGYGLTVTPLQLAQAYAIIGAEGVRHSAQFLKVEKPTSSEQIIDPATAEQLIDMLTGVVEQPGSNAKVVGYHVAGKTGTARKASKNGYSPNEHLSVFAGLIPAKNPRFSIVVMIDKPQGGVYYGNLVAAPIFSKIASGAVRLFNIAPDILEPAGFHVAQSDKLPRE